MSDALMASELARLRARVGELERALGEAVEEIQNGPAPELAHEGSCGPDAGCDGLCMAAAYRAENIRRWTALAAGKAGQP